MDILDINEYYTEAPSLRFDDPPVFLPFVLCITILNASLLQERDTLIATALNPNDHKSFSDTLHLIRSYRLFHEDLNHRQINICIFGSKDKIVPVQDVSIFDRLGAEFHYIEYEFLVPNEIWLPSDSAEVSSSFRDLICAANVAHKHSILNNSHSHVLYINPRLFITSNILNHIKPAPFSCIAGTNLSYFCETEILLLALTHGPALRNILVAYIDYPVPTQSPQELLYHFVKGHMQQMSFMSDHLIVRSSSDWIRGKTAPALLLDNIDKDGKTELFDCIQPNSHCHTHSGQSQCRCVVQVVQPYNLVALTVIDRIFSAIISNQSVCWAISGCTDHLLYTANKTETETVIDTKLEEVESHSRLDSSETVTQCTTTTTTSDNITNTNTNTTITDNNNDNGITNDSDSDSLCSNKASIHNNNNNYITNNNTNTNNNNNNITNVKNRRVFDIFPFFDEFSLLQLRLHLLDAMVHKFIIIEGKQTFQGNPKPKQLYLTHHLHKLSKHMRSKIIHIEINMPYRDNPNYNEIWSNERSVRDIIYQFLSSKNEFNIEVEDEDLLLVCDLDEIIRHSTIKSLLIMTAQDIINDSQRVYKLSMSFFVYNLTSPMGNFLTTLPFAATAGHLRQTYSMISALQTDFITNIRNQIYNKPLPFYNIIARAGWHLSNFKSIQRIQFKLDSYAHKEFDNDVVKAGVADRIKQGRPVEFLMDEVSTAFNAGNVFLQQHTRALDERELVDEEFILVGQLWDKYVTNDDIPDVTVTPYDITSNEDGHDDDGEINGMIETPRKNSKRLTKNKSSKKKKKRRKLKRR
eukprot:gene1247-2419_t